jgi:hypothetical protein
LKKDILTESMADPVNSYFTKGFAVFDGIMYHQQIEQIISDTTWEYEGGINNDWHPSNNLALYQAVLYSVHHSIAEGIAERMFDSYTMDRRRIWQGVNPDATGWHNDIGEGPNCFFLLYHNRMDSDGSVHFRNSTESWELKPYPGLLVAVNCENNFEHRADTSKQQRVQSSYYFRISHGYQY